jgi:signal peptidase I
MRRVLLWVVVVLAVLAAAFVVLDKTFLLNPIGPLANEAPTIPACNGRALAEGITYRLRDPRPGEMVVFHASGTTGGQISPDAKSRQLVVAERVAGVPGDLVSVKRGHVYVNGVQLDDLDTQAFPAVTVPADEYFLLADNRSDGQDSRNFGPVPRNAIFGRVFLVYWPLGHFGGVPTHRAAGPSPGPISC